MNLSGTVQSDYLKLSNLPLLKRKNLINFSNNDFIAIRESLINYAKAAYPGEYEYFVESDLGVMFIEMIAYLGSIMSLKADMLANENYLSTAIQRKSISKLLRLLGVRMRGPLSAASDAQLVLSNTPGGQFTINAQDRVFSVNSPEDGGVVNYTLYTVTNGLVNNLPSDTGTLTIRTNNSSNPTTNTIYDNLAFQEGSLVTERGSFNSSESLKSIVLNEGPVIDGSVQIYITSNDSDVEGAYTEVESLFFASGTNERIFEVSYDDNYNATILFGDGRVGINPDSTSTYFIAYRVGGGTRGNIPKNLINTTINTSLAPTITATITNSSLATGGQNAETVDQARSYAPLTFRRQDRLVTLDDYQVFANQFISTWGSVGKAKAVTRKAYCSANIIDIYVLERANNLQLQKATTNFKTNLLNAINKKKMATDEIVIVDGLIRTIDLVVTIKVDEEQKPNQVSILNKVRDKILNYMNVDNISFGDALRIAELNREIFEIEEVRYSTLDNVEQDIQVGFNEIIQLNNLTINIDFLA